MLEDKSEKIVCCSCGQLKPSTAFSFEKATQTYSTICTDCAQNQSNDHQTEGSRYQLDNKARIKIYQDKIKFLNQVKDETKKILDQKDKQLIQKTIKKELLAHKEKKIRERHLERPAKHQPATKAEVKTIKQPNQTQSDKASGFASEIEEQKKNPDMKFSFIDGHSSTVGRSYSSLFGRFRDYLGKSAPMNTFMRQYGQLDNSKTTNNKPTDTTKLTEDFIKNNLKKP